MISSAAVQQRMALLRPLWLPVVFLGGFLLYGCGSSDTSNGDIAYNSGIIAHPVFGDEQGRLLRPWSLSQHANRDSYEYTIDGGVFTIRRIGEEPWARLWQRIPAEALEGLEGRTMEFALDVRADLNTDEYGDPMEPTGLMVRVWGQPGSTGAQAGVAAASVPVVTERVDIDPEARIEIWERHRVEFAVPQGVTRLEVSVVMSTGGELQLRRPSLTTLH